MSEFSLDKSKTLLNILENSLRRGGVDVYKIWTDDLHPQVQRPVEYRFNPFLRRPTPYYLTLFRWSMGDGAHGALLMWPILRRRGQRYDLDEMQMLSDLAEKIRALAQQAPALMTNQVRSTDAAQVSGDKSREGQND